MYVPFGAVWMTKGGPVYEPLYDMYIAKHPFGWCWRMDGKNKIFFDLDDRFQDVLKRDREFWKQFPADQIQVSIDEIVYKQMTTCNEKYWLQDARPVSIFCSVAYGFSFKRPSEEKKENA